MTNYISDSFTGTNGSAWNSSNWTVTSGGSTTIQGNKGQMAPSTSAPIVIATVPTIPADFTFTGQLELSTTSAQTVLKYRFNTAGTIGYRLILLYDTLLLYSDNAGSGSTLIGYAGGLRYAWDAYLLSYGFGTGTPLPTAGSILSIDDDNDNQIQAVVEGTFPLTGTSTTGSVRIVTSIQDGAPRTNPVNGSTGIFLLPYPKWQANSTSYTAFSIINFRLEVSGTSHKFRYWPKYDTTGALATEPATWTFNLTDTVSTTQTKPIEVKYSEPSQVAGFLDSVSIDSVAASNDKTVSSGVFLGAATRSQPTVTTAVATVASVGVASASTVRPDLSVATQARVGAATRSQPTITVSVSAAAGVGVVTTTQLGVSSDVTTTSGMIVGAAMRSQPTITVSVGTVAGVGVTATSQPTASVSVASVAGVGVTATSQPTITVSVASVAQVGAATRSQPTTSVSVATVAQVGAVTTAQLGVSGDVTTTSGMFVGIATRSQPTITISVGTVAGVGVVTTTQLGASGDITTTSGMFVGASTRSQPTITVSVATVAGVGATASSQPTITVSVATVAGVGATASSQPTISISITTIAGVGALLQSSAALITLGIVFLADVGPDVKLSDVGPDVTLTNAAPDVVLATSKD